MNVGNCCRQSEETQCRHLFAFPGQSNFSGRKYPLDWVEEVKQNGISVGGNDMFLNHILQVVGRKAFTFSRNSSLAFFFHSFFDGRYIFKKAAYKTQ